MTGPPFRYVSWGTKAQGRKHRRTRGPFGVPATVRGCCDGPLQGSESARRAGGRSDPSHRPGSWKPGGRSNAVRADGTHIRPSESGVSPRSAAQAQERAAGPPQGGLAGRITAQAFGGPQRYRSPRPSSGFVGPCSASRCRAPFRFRGPLFVSGDRWRTAAVADGVEGTRAATLRDREARWPARPHVPLRLPSFRPRPTFRPRPAPAAAATGGCPRARRSGPIAAVTREGVYARPDAADPAVAPGPAPLPPPRARAAGPRPSLAAPGPAARPLLSFPSCPSPRAPLPPPPPPPPRCSPPPPRPHGRRRVRRPPPRMHPPPRLPRMPARRTRSPRTASVARRSAAGARSRSSRTRTPARRR